MKALLIIAALLLTGCVTPQEFISRPADAQLKLKGAPLLAAACIARNLENYAGNIIVTQRPTANGQEIIGRQHGEATTIFAIADITTTDSGSAATIWAAPHIFSSTDKVIKMIVNGC